MCMLEEIIRAQHNVPEHVVMHAYISDKGVTAADALFHEAYPVLYARLYPNQSGKRGPKTAFSTLANGAYKKKQCVTIPTNDIADMNVET